MNRFSHQILLFGCCLSTLLITCVASAATIVVDATGGGDTATIQQGLGRSAAGDTVLVLPGVYSENIILKSGVTLLARDGYTNTIIDGQTGSCVEAQRCASGTRVIGFTLTNGGARVGGGVRVFDNTEIEIADNLIINHEARLEGAGVLVQRHSHARIHHNRFAKTTSHRASAVAVIVYSSADIRNNIFAENQSKAHAAAIGVHQSHVVVVDNIFMDNHSAGNAGTVDYFRSTGLVANNTFVGNFGSTHGASAVAVRDPASRVTITRNLFTEQTGGPALLTEICQLVSCNIFWQNEVDHSGDCSPIDQNGNIVADPLLVPGGPGRFQPDSPCLQLICGPVGSLASMGCR